MWHRKYWAQQRLLTTVTEMDLGKPFERITMVDAVKKYAGVDFNEIHTLEEAQASLLDEHHIEYEAAS